MNTLTLVNSVNMLSGGENHEIDLMPYAKRKEEGECEMSPEEEVAAVRRAILKR